MLTQIGLVGALDVFLIEPCQFFRIEAPGRSADALEIEPLGQFLAAEDLGIAMRPAQAREKVDHGVRKVAVLGVLHQRRGAVAFGELLAILTQHGGRMREHRQRRTESMEHVDLARRVVDVIVAANDMRDLHIDIVDHHAEVVGRRAIGTRKHQIIEFFIADLDTPFHCVVPRHHAGERVLEADHRLHTGRCGESVSGHILGTPAAVVARFSPRAICSWRSRSSSSVDI